jgi:hypothetical protein
MRDKGRMIINYLNNRNCRTKKTGQDPAELLTAALTAHAQAIGVLPAPPPIDRRMNC